jgi:preprotein translocase subunit SecG
MVRFTHVLLILTSLFVLGCGNSSSDSKRPYLMQNKTPLPSPKPLSKSEEKIALTVMEAAHQEKMATITANKETQLKKLEVEKSRISDLAREKIVTSENQRKIRVEEEKQKAAVAIEKEKQQTAIVLEKERASLYQQYLIAAVILFLVLMMLLYLIHRRNQRLKLKLHEDTLRHKEYMQASKQHHERVNKTLEILANESTDKHLKKELVKLLKDQGAAQPKLLN